MGKSRIELDREYHAHPALSNTKLAQYVESPRYYEGVYVTKTIVPQRKEITDDMQRGSIIHAVLLEGLALHSVAAIYPKADPLVAELKVMSGPKRDALTADKKERMCALLKMPVADFDALKPGKEMKQAIDQRLPLQPLTASGGFTTGKDRERFESQQREQGIEFCVKRKRFREIRETINEFRRTEAWQWVDREETIQEEPIFWTNRLGMECRCKPDFLIPTPQRVYGFDVKITAFHLPEIWQRQVQKQPRLHNQPPHYIEGIKSKYPGRDVEWRWLLLNPGQPVTKALFSCIPLDGWNLGLATRIYQRNVELLHRATERNDFKEPHEQCDSEIEFDAYWSRKQEERLAKTGAALGREDSVPENEFVGVTDEGCDVGDDDEDDIE